MVIRNKEKIIGYMFALPQDDTFDDYLEECDPNLEKDPFAFYLESVAVLPEEQHRGHYSKMLKRLVAEAQQRGYKKITAHGRSNTFTPLRDKFGGCKNHTIRNCFNYGEPFDYIVYEIEVA